MTNLSPQEPFALKQTNVSSPSVVHKPSEHSITASEDYYSLKSGSGSSTYSGEAVPAAGQSSNTIHRYQTPPSRYRTPLQSRELLPQHAEPEVRKTPIHGQGKRRQSVGSMEVGHEGVTAGPSAAAAGAAVGPLREGGVRRRPVPSTVMEGAESPLPKSDEEIDPTKARSSVARDFDREASPPTPGLDDTPYIRFALDQLTRDEEVRGSRRYRGLGSGVDGNYPYLAPGGAVAPQQAVRAPPRDTTAYDGQRPVVIPGGWPTNQQLHQMQQQQQQQQEQLPPPPPQAAQVYPRSNEDRHMINEPPPRNPSRLSNRSPPAIAELEGPVSQHSRQMRPSQPMQQGPDMFVPIPAADFPAAGFLPGILRPVQLGIYIALLLAFTVCLIFCAIWSLLHTGLWNYGSFGDARYFVFEYLPALLGIILFLWLVQIMVAVYRITPFIAMASSASRTRAEGVRLPMNPHGFVLPYVGHFRAGQLVVGVFMVVAWLQIFSVPLLASSFNAYFFGAPNTGRWRWIATQGSIWVVIALYLLLAVTLVLLLVWLMEKKKHTGLKWDPRSLADVIVLLERSNALDTHDDNELNDAPRLGHWRSSARHNDVFHTYGYADKPARSYSLEDGRIREKQPLAAPLSRFSADADVERGENRHSREKMLPKPNGEDSDSSRHSSALPWFLRPSMAALWAIIAIVLLLAFLIVSYLPSTRVQASFSPDVPAPVNKAGFSSTNFLYSFVPAMLGMLCLLFWLDIDYSYRRLQPFASLATPSGELAERSLLLSYPAEHPFFVTASALANKHYRIALFTLTTLIAATLPILGGGVFWAQFYIPQQRTRVSAHMPGYYALTVLVTLYALSYLFIFPSRHLRHATAHSTSNAATSFHDILLLVRQSRMLDDVAFHSPQSKIDLVTRLLSAPPGARISQHDEAAASKVSLADSVRGFGKARQKALGGLGVMEVPRYALGTHVGRDGREFEGLDRVRASEK